MTEMVGRMTAPSGRIAIVASRFNSLIVDALIKGAKETLVRAGMDESQIDIMRVPGAFELPLACQKVLKARTYQGVIALGAVIQGETPHFDFVSSQAASGIMQVSLSMDTPISFGILTTATTEQAIERSGIKAGNKGEEAAHALIEQVNVLECLHG